MNNSIRDIYNYPVYNDNVGDEVVFIEPNYHNLVIGHITRLTPKGIKAEWISNERKKECFVLEHNFVDIAQFTK